MALPKYSDKFQEAIARAYKKALNVVQKESPADTNSNSQIIAASNITALFIEIDLDEDEDKESGV